MTRPRVAPPRRIGVFDAGPKLSPREQSLFPAVIESILEESIRPPVLLASQIGSWTPWLLPHEPIPDEFVDHARICGYRSVDLAKSWETDHPLPKSIDQLTLPLGMGWQSFSEEAFDSGLSWASISHALFLDDACAIVAYDWYVRPLFGGQHAALFMRVGGKWAMVANAVLAIS